MFALAMVSGALARNLVIPAKARTQSALVRAGNGDWVPAFAGMTNEWREAVLRSRETMLDSGGRIARPCQKARV